MEMAVDEDRGDGTGFKRHGEAVEGKADVDDSCSAEVISQDDPSENLYNESSGIWEGSLRIVCNTSNVRANTFTPAMIGSKISRHLSKNKVLSSMR